MNLAGEIRKLKKEKNAVILTHCYQNIEIDEVSDFTGDSFYLSRKAAETDADIIVFAGVYFMAQSAKLLSPGKRVFLPNMKSGCLMADMIDAESLKAFKAKYPGLPVVCYINSTAEVKAECDICCTSSNAITVIKSLKSPKILFVPDTHLGKWAEKKLGNVEIITYNGYCPAHLRIRMSDIENARRKYPDALILAHPECTAEVTDAADFTGSTKEITEFAAKSRNKQFIIATEKGVQERLQRDYPEKEFILINEQVICPNMKYNTLADIYNVLENEINEIFIPPETAQRAKVCIDRMLKAAV